MNRDRLRVLVLDVARGERALDTLARLANGAPAEPEPKMIETLDAESQQAKPTPKPVPVNPAKKRRGWVERSELTGVLLEQRIMQIVRSLGPGPIKAHRITEYLPTVNAATTNSYMARLVRLGKLRKVQTGYYVLA